MENYIGIIDLGSNSARLAIYYVDQQGLMYEFDNFKRVLRLGEHIKEDGNIDQEGYKSTIECMQQFKKVCTSRHVNETIAVATAAVRQAKNGKDLLREIKDKTDISFRLLSGEEEANYGYLAVVNSMNISNVISVDIGGGSTEVTLIENRKTVKSYSFPFGALTLSKKFFKNDVPNEKEILNLREYLQQQFALEPWLKNHSYPLVVIGGTARNLAKIHQRKIGYPLSSLHGYSMKTEEVAEIFRWISQLSLEARKKIDGLSKDRVDILHTGIFVFHTLMEWVNSSELITSNKGLRDGILFEKFLKYKGVYFFEDVAMFSAEQFMNRYHVDKTHARHVAYLAMMIYERLNQLGILSYGEEERRILKIASLLHDIGRSINIYNTDQHTFYLISNVLLMGVSQRERVLTAFVSSYRNHRLLKQKFKEYEMILKDEDEKKIHQLGHILLLARTLDRSMSQLVEKIEIEKQKKEMILTCIGPKDLVEYQLTEELIQKFSKVFQTQFSLKVKKK